MVDSTLYRSRSRSGVMSLSSIVMFLVLLVLMFLPRRMSFGIDVYKAVLIVDAVLVLAVNSGKFRLRFTEINIFMILFYSYALFRYVSDFNYVTGIGLLMDTVLMLLLSINILSSKENLSLFIKMFTVGLIIYSLLCFVEALTNINIFNIISGKSLEGYANSMRYGIYRPYGSFTTSINNGLFLSLASGFMLYFAINGYKNRKLYGIACVLGAVACILTLSRGPLIGMFFFYIVCLFKAGMWKIIYRHPLPVVLLIGIVCVLLVIPSTQNAILSFYNMFASIWDNNIASEISDSFGLNANGIGNRIDLYDWIMDSIKGHELFGVGTVKLFSYRFFANDYTYHIKQSIENQYLFVIYQFGFAGLTVYVLFWVKEIVKLLRRTLRKKMTGLKDFDFIMLVTIIEYLIVLFTVSTWDEVRFVFLMLGISTVYINLYKKGQWTELLERI